jgi:tetratricopeptide (TPR) repeat protein
VTALGRTFRVFISSTFDDMAVERNALQRDVFPKLQKLCTAQGCSFQAIDLRWGVSQEAGLAQRTISICLEEIARCQRVTPRPNFLVMLGNRYGWQPLPEQIAAVDFDRLQTEVDNPVDRALLGDWYLEDHNAVSTVRYLRPRRLDLPPDATHEAEQAIRDAEQAAWNETETRLRRILKAAAGRLVAGSLSPGVELVSAVEREVYYGALAVADAAEHVVCVFREPSDPPEAGDVLDEPDPEDCYRLAELKARLTRHLQENNILRLRARHLAGSVSPDYLQEFCHGVLERLSRIIRQQIAQLQASDDLEVETREHKRFAEELISPTGLCGRDEELAQIAKAVAGSQAGMVVITADPGMGKSALIAEASRQVARSVPQAKVILRHVGATAESSDLRSLLFGLTREIAAAYGDQRPVPRDLFALIREWQARANLARADKPLVVFLDGADIATASREVEPLAWLPAAPLSHVHLIVSVSEPLSAAVAARVAGAPVIRLTRLSRAQASPILDQLLAAQGRQLQPQQRDLVLSRFDLHGSPLFLRLAAQQAACWRSHETPELGSTPRELAEAFLAGLEHPANHGEMFVRRTLSYLASSRHGLSEDELLRILAADREVVEYVRLRTAPQWRDAIDRVPAAVWSRLFFDLRPHLTEHMATGTVVLAFASESFRQVVRERYARDVGEVRHSHAALADFFRGEADPTGDGVWLGAAKRGFSEVAYHYYEDAQLADSLSCPSAKAISRLTADERFRERQFLALEDIAPVLEIYHQVLRLAIQCGTTANVIEVALRRLYLAGAIHRSLMYQLYSLAANKPNLASAVIDLLPTASDRIVGSAFCAWVEWDAPESRERARARVKGVCADATGFVQLAHVPLLVRLAVTLTTQGLDEATGLAQFVPDCVQRDCYIGAWLRLTDARGAVARAMDQFHPRYTPSSTEAELCGRVDRLVQRSLVQGRLPVVGPLSHPLEELERWAMNECGETGISVMYALVAPHLLVRDEEEFFRLVVSRSLGQRHSFSADRHCLTQLSMIKALTAAGRTELAQEHRDRMVTALRTPFRLTQNPSVMGFYQLMYAELHQCFSQRELMFQPAMGAIASAAHKMAAARAVDIEEVDHLLLKAGLDATLGRDGVAATSVTEVLHRLPAEDRLNAAERMAADALRATVENEASPPRDAPAQEAGRIDTRGFIKAIQSGVSSGVGATYAFAAALRRIQAGAQLRQLLEAVCGHRSEQAAIDAVTAQLPLEGGLSAAQVGDISNAIERCEPVLGVNSGMGVYYLTSYWVRAVLLGTLLICAGGAAHSALPSVALIMWAGLLGGLGDLYVWRGLHMWDYPERSRRTAAEYGTYVSAVTVLFLERDILAHVIRESQLAYGMLCAALVAALVFAWRRLAPWRVGYGLTRKECHGLIVATLVSACLAAIVSTLFAAWGDQGFRAGLALGGSVVFGLGLNLLVKHIPVRRYYERKGIRTDFDRLFGTLAAYDQRSPACPLSPLIERITKADAKTGKRRHAVAIRSYNGIIAHVDFAALPARRRASVYVNRGMCYRGLRQYADALADFSAASALNPVDFAPHMNAALVLGQDLARYREALAEFDLVVECDPLRPDAYSSRSIAKGAMNDVAGAEADLTMALRLDPTHPDALYNLGILLWRQGRSHEGVDLLGKALATAPRDADIRFFYALALADCGRVNEAKQVAMQDPRAARKWIEANRRALD